MRLLQLQISNGIWIRTVLLIIFLIFRGFTAPYLAAIKSSRRNVVIFATLSCVRNMNRLRLKILSIVLCILFIVTTCQEYNKDGRVYVATILGCIFTVVYFIIACTNMAPALGYDKSHLNAVLCRFVFSLDHLGSANLDGCFVFVPSLHGICLSVVQQIDNIPCND